MLTLNALFLVCIEQCDDRIKSSRYDAWQCVTRNRLTIFGVSGCSLIPLGAITIYLPMLGSQARCSPDRCNHKRAGVDIPHEDIDLSPTPTLQTSIPPSPPIDTRSCAQSTLRTFRPPSRPSQALKLVTALLMLRRSQRRTTPSYAPETNWCSGVDGDADNAIDDGVAGCIRVATDDVVADVSPTRRSYWQIVRSVEAASTLCPGDKTARSRNGFDDAV